VKENKLQEQWFRERKLRETQLQAAFVCSTSFRLEKKGKK
jgi:hypothetical protein